MTDSRNVFDVITSPRNQRLKLVRKLLSQRRMREREKAFVLEGPRAVRAWLKNGRSCRFLLSRGSSSSASNFTGTTGPVLSVAPPLFDDLADTVSPQDCLAVADTAETPLPRLLARMESDPRPLLCLDRIQDPGNLGTMLRTAAAFGFAAAIETKGTCDRYNPKVVRATAGTLGLLDRVRVSDVEALLEAFQATPYRVLFLTPQGEHRLTDLPPDVPSLVVLGNEGRGLDLPDPGRRTTVRIDQERTVESLNVAVSFGIVAHHLY